MNAIVVSNLVKSFNIRLTGQGFWGSIDSLWRPRYRHVQAVDNISFTLQAGERVAFVGPNGAGKSTTIKMLTGILHPTAGAVAVLGLNPVTQRRQLAYKIGTVFGQRSQLWYHLPTRDTLQLLARVYDLEDSFYQKRLQFLVDIFAIGSLLEKPVRSLSLGERMRCEIVASLLHKPQVLFLDEPTIGLDVTAKATIRDLILQASREDGMTVLLTSHDTGDMEKVCDRVIIINEGQLLLDKPVVDLRRTYIQKKYISLQTVEKNAVVNTPFARVVSTQPHKIVLEIDTSQTSIDVVVQALIGQVRLQDLSVEDPPMEEIIKAIYVGTKAAA